MKMIKRGDKVKKKGEEDACNQIYAKPSSKKKSKNDKALELLSTLRPQDPRVYRNNLEFFCRLVYLAGGKLTYLTLYGHIMHTSAEIDGETESFPFYANSGLMNRLKDDGVASKQAKVAMQAHPSRLYETSRLKNF
jgi:hypothetical protein